MQPTIWNDERITAYVLGELSAEDSATLEADMQANADLATAVEDARRITTALSSLFAAEPTMTLDATKRQQILETPLVTPSESSTAAVGSPLTTSSRSGLHWMELAATVLLIGTLGTIAFRAARPDRTIVAMSAAREPVADAVDASTVMPENAVSLMPEPESPASILEAESLELADGVLVAPSSDGSLRRGGQPLTQMPADKEKSSNSANDLELSDGVRNFSLPASGAPAPGMSSSPTSQAVRTSDIVDPRFASPSGASASVPAEPMAAQKPAAKAEYQADGIKKEDEVGEELLKNQPEEPVDSMMRDDFDVLEGRGLGREKLARGRYQLSQEGVTDMPSQLGSALSDEASHSERTRELDSVSEFGTVDRKQMKEVELRSMQVDALNYIAPLQTLDAGGMGAGMGGDRFDPIVENDFRRVSEQPLSTFSIDVDTASYSKVRQFIMQSGSLPPAGAVRVEELINYFDYQYEPPSNEDEHPFASRVEIAACPWKPEHRLARIGIKGKEMKNEARPASNLVFLIDTSGSMEEPNKLPLVKQGLQKLVAQLGEKDRVAIVVYAGSAGLVLDSTVATERSTILRKINQMQSGGSTNGGEGIKLAYQVARDHFIKEGVNRVILCSDGDFNVGTTSDDELVSLVETEAKGGIDITVLGFGMGNHNDSMMEKISGRGNGNYAFIDTEAEAKRVLVDQTSSTLVTIARDVKIQVEFNPAEVSAYRLIGYENRRLANEDFKDDTKDAGEIGAGHEVTALYELIPATGDTATLAPEIDELRYQQTVAPTEASSSGEVMTVKLRYKKPGSDVSVPVSFPAKDEKRTFDQSSEDFRFAASVAGFGMLLRSSEYIGNWTLSDVERVATAAKTNDSHGLRAEFIEIVRRASGFRSGENPQ